MDEQVRRLDDALASLPAPAPLVMPPQVLRGPRRPRNRTAVFARVMLALAVAGTTYVFAINLYAVLSVQQPTPLQLVFWVAATLCFAWIAIGASSAVIGFALLVTNQLRPSNPETPVADPAASRTALLFPVYSEDPGEVAATIEAMADDLDSGGSAIFDVFILSDTQDQARRSVERRFYTELAIKVADRMRIYARWRTPNTAKKAGNIGDWITSFGGAYRYFVILDADSIMTGRTLHALVGAMEADARLGLLQTVPRLVGARTTIARAQQFAGAYYGPLVATGIAAWQGDSGNYWGHNAIIRTEAFASSAGLPELPGKPPLGGHVLSHDFVEAALLVRAGWRVRLDPVIGGSYEGCPPTLDELLTRDRRWAQGNLQHLKIVRASKLAAISRLHLALGAWSYLASPVWAATLLVGLVLAVEGKYANPSYFGSEISLFPQWPVFDSEKALALFVATLAVVHLPKILGIAWAAWSGRAMRRGKSIIGLIGGGMLESVLAAIVAPILMVGQTIAVLAILAGRDSGWGAQRRTVRHATLVDHIRQYKWQTAVGVVTAVVCGAISWSVLAWMSPVIVGLIGAAPIAMLTGRTAPRFIESALRIGEDLAPTPLLLARDDYRTQWSGPKPPSQ